MFKRFVGFLLIFVVAFSTCSIVATAASTVQLNQPSVSYGQKTASSGSFDQALGDSSVGVGQRRVIVGLNKTRPEAYSRLADLVKQVGGEVVDDVSIEGRPIALVANVPASSYSFLMKMALAGGLSRYVEPSIEFRAQFTPNDPSYSYQWAPAKIQADWAWNVTTGNSSVLVGIVDTGIDYGHPDLVANYVPLGYNWVNNSSDPLDDNGHGTHVAGIIAATINNGLGVAGIAQVHIMAEKALNATGWGDEVNLSKAIIHAVNQGAKILSNSWGSYSDSSLIHDAVGYAYDHNVLVVAAAGNDNSNAPMYPAAYPEVVSVAATGQFDFPASFSNWGDWIDVSAPGVQVYSTMPTYHVTLNDYPYYESMNYDYLSGTSMACPHVSAVAALIWSEFSSASRNWVREQLMFSADDLGTPGFDMFYGWGRINAYNAILQGPSQHDVVLFSFQKPRSIQPGDLVQFSVTVLNFGTHDQTGLVVQLLVDSAITDYAIVPILPAGAFSSVTLQWSPQAEGSYNVTFYVEPVLGETKIDNNAISTTIEVHFLLTLTPSSGSVGTALTVEGRGFTPLTPVAVAFNDMFIGSVTSDVFGDFNFTFNVPVSQTGRQVVKAYDSFVNGTSDFTVVDVSPLNVQLESGALHFGGEIVTFYVQTAFRGEPVNVTITGSLLYKPDGTTDTLTFEPVATGLYKGSYTLQSEVQTGSYALSVTALYETGTVESRGTSFSSFLVSPTMSGWNALLVGLNGTVATVKTDLGLVQVQFDEINASLAGFSGNMATLNSTLGTIRTDLDTINLKITAINGTTATIQTILGTLNGTVTSINDQTATIMVPKIGQVQTDISGLKQTSAAWTIPQYIIAAGAAIAAVGAIAAVALLRRRKTLKNEIPAPPIVP